MVEEASSTWVTVCQSVAPAEGKEQCVTFHIDKHSRGKPFKPSAVAKSDACVQAPHPVVYEKVDGPMILSVSLKTDGAAGPSGINAAGWKHLLSLPTENQWNCVKQ